jgi:hypothetical protein
MIAYHSDQSFERTWPVENFQRFGDADPLPFDEIPQRRMREAYGMRYVEIPDASGGRLWVNRYGWRLVKHLRPANWYFGNQYARRGTRLSEGSGTVYRVPVGDTQGRPIELVVKFSRIAQEVQLNVSSCFQEQLPPRVVENACFNDPFQEFGLLEELRTGEFGPSGLRVLTKRPLAIYSPATRYQPWQLGRSEHLFHRHRHQLDRHQTLLHDGGATIDLSRERQYITLFHWVHGVDAHELVRQGRLAPREARGLVRDAIEDLAAKGFRVLDTKPNHLILRTRRDGSLLRRDGKLVYVLVDFELLQRTAQYERWRQARVCERCDDKSMSGNFG